jgi:hypothetical protein
MLNVIQKLEGITFKVETNTDKGTGFAVLGRLRDLDNTLTIATAWHVIEDLYKATDKWKRYIKITAASGAITIEANAVGVARLGPDGSDIGMVWIGKALSSESVNSILKALAESGIPRGLIDLSGGGGIIKTSPYRRGAASDAIVYTLHREQVVKGMSVGWLGYPSVAPDSPCYFSGRIAGFLDHLTPPMYLIDGTGIKGLSGGPVFDDYGRILGIVSSLIVGDKSSRVLAVVPIDAVNLMLFGKRTEGTLSPQVSTTISTSWRPGASAIILPS